MIDILYMYIHIYVSDQETMPLVWNLGPFSISLLKQSQLEDRSWSQSSNLLQTGFLSCAQVSDLGEILTWNSS